MGGIGDRLVHRLPPWVREAPRGRLLAGAAVVLVILVLAVSCGGAGGTVDVPVQGGKADGGVSGVRAPSTAPGGTLRIVAGQVDSLDPQRSYLPGVWDLMRLYTRTLVTYGRKPGHTGELVPDLATDTGSSSDGGKTWTFHLRGGADFSTGRAVTAQDVKYGIERSFASDVVVGGPTYVVDLLDPPGNPYPGPYQDTAKDKLGLSTVQTPDDRTIVFHLRAADPDFPYVLALPSSSPVPAESDTKGAYAQAPVSSGPYVVTAVDDQTGIQLGRNPHWKKSADPVRTALPEHVVVRTGLSGIERDQAMLAGSADADITGAGVQPATTARLSDSASLRDRMDDVTTGAMRLLALPTTVAPMDNAACRRAVGQAIDRTAVQKALGGADDAVRSSQLWPRGLPGGPDDADPRPDPAGARASLAACGKPQGFSTVLAVSDAPATVQVARTIAGELAAVGIKADVKPSDPSTFYATGIGDPDNVTRSGIGIVLASWTADFPTAGSFLAPLVDGRAIRPVGNTDYGHLNDPAIDTLIDKARGGGGEAAWRAVSTAALKTGAYVPLAENRIQLVSGERLRNGVVMQPYSAYDLATAGVR